MTLQWTYVLHSRVSLPQHCWHLGPVSSFLHRRRGHPALQSVGCTEASLASTHQLPVGPLPHEWQSQMSPNIAKCPLGTGSPSVKIHCYNEDFKDFLKGVLWIFMLYKITHNKIKHSELQKYCLDTRNESRGLPGGCGWRVCLPTQRHRFNPWTGKIPHAAVRLSSCAAATEPVL